jgi:hypothetical protein
MSLCGFLGDMTPHTLVGVELRPPSRQRPARARIVETAQVRPGYLEGNGKTHTLSLAGRSLELGRTGTGRTDTRQGPSVQAQTILLTRSHGVKMVL